MRGATALIMMMVTVLELMTTLCILDAKKRNTSHPTKQHQQQNRPTKKQTEIQHTNQNW